MIPCVIALCTVPLGAVAGSSPPRSGDGPDGRADWRLPASVVGTGAVESPPAPLATPTIEPLPVQIVSAGRVIRLKVRAHLDDGRSPRLTIDRLPASASFDENPDGSRTLYWPTRDVDRGDHRFRITARHPDDERRASGVDALITVGTSAVGEGAPDSQAAVPGGHFVPDDYFREIRLDSPSSGGARGDTGPDGRGGGYFDPVDADAADAHEPDPFG